MGSPIVHVEIAVTDLERSKHFYGEAFHWTFQDWPGAAMPYALFQTGADGIGGALEQAAMPRPGGGVTIYVEVPELESALQRVTMLGGAITMKPVQVSPEVGWCAAVDDPDGNRIGLYQRIARSGVTSKRPRKKSKKKAKKKGKKK